MDDLITLVKDRQRSLSTEKFANTIGLTTSTMWRFYNKKGAVNVGFIRKMAAFFAAAGDIEMIGALAKFALQLPTNNDMTNIKKIGSLILEI